MAFQICLGPCIGCGRVFTFNPNYVPSIRINGTRQPVCKTCIDEVNPKREANGLEPIVVHPLAYEADEVA